MVGKASWDKQHSGNGKHSNPKVNRSIQTEQAKQNQQTKKIMSQPVRDSGNQGTR